MDPHAHEWLKVLRSRSWIGLKDHPAMAWLRGVVRDWLRRLAIAERDPWLEGAFICVLMALRPRRLELEDESRLSALVGDIARDSSVSESLAEVQGAIARRYSGIDQQDLDDLAESVLVLLPTLAGRAAGNPKGCDELVEKALRGFQHALADTPTGSPLEPGDQRILAGLARFAATRPKVHAIWPTSGEVVSDLWLRANSPGGRQGIANSENPVGYAITMATHVALDLKRRATLGMPRVRDMSSVDHGLESVARTTPDTGGYASLHEEWRSVIQPVVRNWIDKHVEWAEQVLPYLYRQNPIEQGAFASDVEYVLAAGVEVPHAPNAREELMREIRTGVRWLLDAIRARLSELRPTKRWDSIESLCKGTKARAPTLFLLHRALSILDPGDVRTRELRRGLLPEESRFDVVMVSPNPGQRVLRVREFHIHGFSAELQGRDGPHVGEQVEVLASHMRHASQARVTWSHRRMNKLQIGFTYLDEGA